jgi:hypothetical protein
VSTTTIQICILLGGYEAGHGQIESENIYYNLGGRMAQMLDLPNAPASSPLEREVNIRSQ